MIPQSSNTSGSLKPSCGSRSWAAGALSLIVVWTGLQTAISLSRQAESSKVRFTNVGRKAGLDAVTVFGGKETNKYLLETTGCGVAFLDYNNDGFLDIFQVNGSVLEGFPKGRSRPITYTGTGVTALLKMSHNKRDSRTAVGDRASAWVTMTMMGMSICSSVIGDKTNFIGIEETEPLRMLPKRQIS